MFPNEKRGPSAVCTADRRAGLRAAEKGGAGCRKGQPSDPLFSAVQLRPTVQPALMCSPLARPVVKPAGPPFCAGRQPAENSCFSFGNTALQPARPAGPPFSVIHPR